MRFADLDAVTIDALGTLIVLTDPVPALRRALSHHGVERGADEVQTAFATEVAYYKPRSLRGHDPASLADLRLECTRVFLGSAGAELDPEAFVDDFIGAIGFEPLPGALDTVAKLRARGLEVAVVSNWDCGLHEHLAGLGIDTLFTAIVTSAEAGAAKPDPAVLELALARLGVDGARAIHVGDEPADREAAAAAGVRFAAAPLPTAFEGWT